MSLGTAHVYLETGRYLEAAEECRKEVVRNPDNGYVRAMLALCLTNAEKHGEAKSEAEKAVGLDPDLGFTHYVLGIVLNNTGKHKQAERAFREAVRLEPEHEMYHVMLGYALGAMGRWQAALAEAHEALAVDPDCEDAQHLRTLALSNLGRKAEAMVSANQTLHRNPDDPMAHANLGWQALRASNSRQAVGHFKEALRLDPELEYAQEGLVEALRLRVPVYRVILGFVLWAGSLPSGAQWAVWIGVIIGFRVVRTLYRQNPQFAGILLPLVILYGSFVFCLWGRRPLFDLSLLMHPLGRLALPKPQRVYTSLFGISLLFTIAGLAGGWATGIKELYVVGGLYGACLVMFIYIEMISDVRKRLIYGWIAFTAMTAIVAAGTFLWMVGGTSALFS